MSYLALLFFSLKPSNYQQQNARMYKKTFQVINICFFVLMLPSGVITTSQHTHKMTLLLVQIVDSRQCDVKFHQSQNNEKLYLNKS